MNIIVHKFLKQSRNSKVLWGEGWSLRPGHGTLSHRGMRSWWICRTMRLAESEEVIVVGVIRSYRQRLMSKLRRLFLDLQSLYRTEDNSRNSCVFARGLKKARSSYSLWRLLRHATANSFAADLFSANVIFYLSATRARWMDFPEKRKERKHRKPGKVRPWMHHLREATPARSFYTKPPPPLSKHLKI